MYESFKGSAGHYADSVKSSKDPLIGLIRDVSSGAGDLGSRLRGRFSGWGGSNQTGRGTERGTDSGTGPDRG